MKPKAVYYEEMKSRMSKSKRILKTILLVLLRALRVALRGDYVLKSKAVYCKEMKSKDE
ncbi:hypothetical protein V6255_08480 [Psychromonas arctica]|uniref:Uncharacterized protein n=1 Tax=Psychromonas arctica TaxID=168275 RepID=A0ABU9HBD9_9GAMM